MAESLQDRIRRMMGVPITPAAPIVLDPNETVYQQGVRQIGDGLGRAAEFIPLAGVWNNLITPAVERLNSPVRPGAKPAAAGAGAPAIVLTPPASAAPAISLGADPRIARNQALQVSVASVFPNAVFSGGAGQVRNPEDYARLIAQGAPAVQNSRHNDGLATDFNVPGKGAKDLPEVRATLRARGVPFEDVIYHNNHFHLELPKGAEQANAPGGLRLSAPSPEQVMSYLPNPVSLSSINLPDAPQLQAPDPRSMLELADKAGLLGPIEEAMKITPRDQRGDAWERIQGMLGGAARAAASGDPSAGIGELILRAGAGGLGGFQEERGDQRAKNEQEQEAQRQMRIALARMGFDIDTANLDTRNQNRNITWQSGEDTRQTANANTLSADERLTQEILANQGIMAQNVGNYNQANMARGQVGAQALSNQYDVANQGAQLAWQTNAQLQERQVRQGGIPGAAPLLQRLGISPERTPDETPQVTNAREAAGRIAAQGGSAGASYLASELLLDGSWDSELVFPEAVRSQIKSAIQQERPEAARLLILQQFQGNPTALAALAKQRADAGSLVGQMMVVK